LLVPPRMMTQRTAVCCDAMVTRGSPHSDTLVVIGI
jgi:hypothetical protein